MSEQEINEFIQGVVGWQADFCNDLNAMHKAEESLTDFEYEAYWDELILVCILDKYERLNSATAWQRARAFEKAHNKNK